MDQSSAEFRDIPSNAAKILDIKLRSDTNGQVQPMAFQFFRDARPSVVRNLTHHCLRSDVAFSLSASLQVVGN